MTWRAQPTRTVWVAGHLLSEALGHDNGSWTKIRDGKWERMTFLPAQAPGHSQALQSWQGRWRVISSLIASCVLYFCSSSKTACSFLFPAFLWHLCHQCPSSQLFPAKLNPSSKVQFRGHHETFPHYPSQSAHLPFSAILKEVFIVNQTDSYWVMTLWYTLW